MGWEYRIFFVPSDANTMVLPPDQAPHSDIPRTDHYYAHSSNVGIKKRGGGTLELKLRGEIDESGFEKWKKWKIASFDELKRVLCENNGSDSLEITEGSAVVVSIGKRRRIGFREGMQMEETDLVVQCRRGNNDGESDAVDEIWKTIAVEGKRNACAPIKDALPDLCKAHAINGDIRECGYAEFVSDIAASTKK